MIHANSHFQQRNISIRVHRKYRVSRENSRTRSRNLQNITRHNTESRAVTLSNWTPARFCRVPLSTKRHAAQIVAEKLIMPSEKLPSGKPPRSRRGRGDGSADKAKVNIGKRKAENTGGEPLPSVVDAQIKAWRVPLKTWRKSFPTQSRKPTPLLSSRLAVHRCMISQDTMLRINQCITSTKPSD